MESGLSCSQPKTKLQSQEYEGSTTWGCSRVSEQLDVHSEAEEPETDNRKGFWGSCPLKKQETSGCTNRVFMSSCIYQRALWHEHHCTSWRCCTAWCSGDRRWLLVTRTNSRHEKLCLSSKCETASQQLWGSEGCHYHVHISSDSSDDTSGHPCCHYPNHWSSAAKRQLWLRRRAGPTAQMTQCLWLLLYSNVRVEATAKHIFYFFEKRPCVCCSKFLIHCHCPTEYVGSYFPLACELYRNTAPDAGKVQRAESFSETTETRRERLPFRATRLSDWLKEYKNSS